MTNRTSKRPLGNPSEVQNGLKELMDPESQEFLKRMTEQEQFLANRIPGVKFVLIVLSARGMVYDLESLRQKVLISYPDAAVFFQNTMGKPIGFDSPQKVDLLIDLTGPGQRQGWFYSKKLRKMARFAVGRNAGWFRKKIYDRVYDEIQNAAEVPSEMLQRERFVQKKVLNLAGVSFFHSGEALSDRGKSIALELPAMARFSS
ncbi:MAG: hypothetical protein ACO3A2_08285 [Bdellovibrionia bacterium]